MRKPGPPAEPIAVRLLLPVQWGEMDAYGHVNNVVYFRWFESARMEYFARIGWPEIERATGVGPILHSTQARFRAPLHWPDEVEVGASVAELLDDRLTMRYAVSSRSLGRLVAEGSGVVVAFDYRAKTKTRLPEAVRARIAELEAAAK